MGAGRQGFLLHAASLAGREAGRGHGFLSAGVFPHAGDAGGRRSVRAGQGFPADRGDSAATWTTRTGRVLATVQNGDGGEFAHFLRHAGRQVAAVQRVQRTGSCRPMFGPHDDLFLISRAARRAARSSTSRLPIWASGRRRRSLPEGEDAIVTSFIGAVDGRARRRIGCIWCTSWAGRRRCARSTHRRQAGRRRRSSSRWRTFTSWSR